MRCCSLGAAQLLVLVEVGSWCAAVALLWPSVGHLYACGLRCRLTEKEGADGMMKGAVRCAHQVLLLLLLLPLLPQL